LDWAFGNEVLETIIAEGGDGAPNPRCAARDGLDAEMGLGCKSGGVLCLSIEVQYDWRIHLRQSTEARSRETRSRQGQIEERQVEQGMTDWMNLAALICAVVASTGFGLMAAYGVLRVGFRLMRPQPRRAAVKPELSVARSQ
jgi:hypothetical protein